MKITRHEDTEKGEALEYLLEQKFEIVNPSYTKFYVDVFKTEEDASKFLDKMLPKKEKFDVYGNKEEISLACYLLKNKRVNIVAVLDSINDLFEENNIDYALSEEIAHMDKAKDFKKMNKLREHYWKMFIEKQYNTKLDPHESQAGYIITDLFFELNAVDLLDERGLIEGAFNTFISSKEKYEKGEVPTSFTKPAIYYFVQKNIKDKNRAESIKKIQDLFWDKTPMLNKENIRKVIEDVVDKKLYKSHKELADYLLV